MSGANEVLYDQLLDQVEAAGEPFLLLGDHNMAPSAMAGFLAARAAAAVVAAPAAPTCVAGEAMSVLDYAVVHRVLGTLLTRPEVQEGYGLSPHRVVVGRLRLPGPDERVRVWCRPSFGFADRVYGPMAPEAKGAADLGNDVEKFAEVFGDLEATREPTQEDRDRLAEFLGRWASLAYQELGPNCSMQDEPLAPLRFAERPLREVIERSGRSTVAPPSLRAARRLLDWAREVRGIASRRARGCSSEGLEYRAQALRGVLRKAAGDTAVAAAAGGHLQAALGGAAVAGLLQALVPGGGKHELVLAGAVVVTVEAAVEAEVRAGADARREAWSQWAEEAFEGSASAAYRFISRGTPADGLNALVDVRTALHEDAEAWHDIWGSSEVPPAVSLQTGLPLPPRLTATELAEASRRFGSRTAAVDGLHPRQLQYLSMGVLEVLAKLLRCFEVFGVLGGSEREDLVVRLIPKATGGSRPIMLFRTLFRVWGKARAGLLGRWAATALAHPRWNNFNGRRPGDGVWRSLLRADSEAVDGAVVLGALFDISKMFDRVDRQRLLEAAADVDYPMWALRLTCTAYGWRRTLVSPDGLAGPSLFPHRGVAAGSFAAVFEVAALVAGAMELYSRRWPEIHLSIHVDDFSVEAVYQDAGKAAVHFAAAGSDLCEVLEKDLGLPVGRAKTAVVASDPTVGRRAAGLLSGVGGQLAAAPRRLGVRWAVAPSRDRALQRARLAALKVKVGRLHILARACAKRRRAGGPGKCYAALLAGPLYGTEVQPLREADLRRLRSEAARLLRISMPGASPGLIWALQPPGHDPAARHWWGVMLRWNREWFYVGAGAGETRPLDCLSPPVLVRVYEAACRRWEAAVRAGRTPPVQGPIDGVLRAAQAAGWVFEEANKVRDRDGSIIDLLHAAPIAVQRKFYRDFQRQAAATALRERCPDAPTMHDPDLDTVRRVLAGRGKDALAREEKAALRALAAGGVPTMARLHRWGQVDDDRCPICGRQDSVEHRIFGPCDGWPEEDELEEQRPLCSRSDHEAAGGVVRPGDDLAAAWFPRLRRPEGPWAASGFDLQAGGEEGRAVAGQSFQFTLEGGPVFVDGSCIAPLTPYASAAGAAVQVRPDGDVSAWLTFAVPADWEQTAAAAEHLAFCFADRFAAKGIEIVTDCAAVLASARAGRRFACGERRPWAALWRDASSGRQAAKVKAHLTEAAARDRGEQGWWAGNQAADRLANGRARAGQPPAGKATESDAVGRLRAAFFRAAARALVRYPRARDMLPDRSARKAAPAEQLVLFHGHAAIFCPKRMAWTCTVCCRRAPAGRAQAFAQAACGRTGGILTVAGTARTLGHDVFVSYAAGGHAAVCACVRCGAYAETQAQKLALPCTGRVQGGGTAARLKRFLGGLHPRDALTLDEPVRFLGG